MKKFELHKSTDALTVIVNGEKRQPEPAYLIVKFPGGEIELTRTSDGGSYWAHVNVSDGASLLDSRVDYQHDTHSARFEAGKKPIPKIEDQEHIKHMAIRVQGPAPETY